MNEYFKLIVGLIALSGIIYMAQNKVATRIRNSGKWFLFYFIWIMLVGIALQNIFLFFVPNAA